MKKSLEEREEIEAADPATRQRANWRMPIHEQVRLHQTLARRRMQQAYLDEPEDKMVFLEAADEYGLFFGQATEYEPFSGDSADEHTS